MPTETATAIAMPGSTPRRTTPRNAAIDSRNSVRRRCQSSIVAGRSASEREAAITTAARVGWGRLRSSPGNEQEHQCDRECTHEPVSCVFAPACSATAVREPLVLTGKPWKRPAAMFAAPMPTISCVPVDLLAGPRRRTRMPSRSCRSARRARCPPLRRAAAARSERPTSGSVSGGNPCGSVPTSDTPCSASWNRVAADDRQDDRDEDRWDLRQQALEDEDHREAERARPRAAAGTVSPSATPFDEPLQLVDEAVARRRRIRRASAAARPGSSAPDRSCSRSSSASRAGRRRSRAWRCRPSAMIAPTRSASIEASATARFGSPSAPTSGRIVAAIIGPSDESGPRTRIFDGPKIA